MAVSCPSDNASWIKLIGRENAWSRRLDQTGPGSPPVKTPRQLDDFKAHRIAQQDAGSVSWRDAHTSSVRENIIALGN